MNAVALKHLVLEGQEFWVLICFSDKYYKKKSNLHYTRDDTPELATSGETHPHG